jgi:glycosyltransferase involved in cell wall biosynthesis
LRLLRSIIFNSFDRITFLNKKTYEYANAKAKLPKHFEYLEWGADVDFFTKSKNNQASNISPNKEKYFITVGASNRDFQILIESFKSIESNLKIYGNVDVSKLITGNIPTNVHIDKELVAGAIKGDAQYDKWIKLREAYHNSIAVLIPLLKQRDIPTGVTVLLEAAACKKPLIVTDNVIFPFDVEKEKIGFKVAYGDKEGWIKAINYTLENPYEAQQMGERAYQLCLAKFNYEIYKNELFVQIKKFQTELKLN